jgi:hypothetical protein
MTSAIREAVCRLAKRLMLLRRRKRISNIRYIPSMTDLPSRLGSTLFVVEKAGSPRWAVLQCPCRCGDRIDINLMSSSRFRWRLLVRNSRVTISPSIWRPLDRCGSHFLIIDNHIRWV